METKLTITRKTFLNKEGENIVYFQLTTELDGNSFLLRVDDKDKKLFNYLLKSKKEV